MGGLIFYVSILRLGKEQIIMKRSEIYVEPGKSGKSITGREVFQKMLNEISSEVLKPTMYWCLNYHDLGVMQRIF